MSATRNITIQEKKNSTQRKDTEKHLNSKRAKKFFFLVEQNRNNKRQKTHKLREKTQLTRFTAHTRLTRIRW